MPIVNKTDEIEKKIVPATTSTAIGSKATATATTTNGMATEKMVPREIVIEFVETLEARYQRWLKKSFGKLNVSHMKKIDGGDKHFKLEGYPDLARRLHFLQNVEGRQLKSMMVKALRQYCAYEFRTTIEEHPMAIDSLIKDVEKKLKNYKKLTGTEFLVSEALSEDWTKNKKKLDECVESVKTAVTNIELRKIPPEYAINNIKNVSGDISWSLWRRIHEVKKRELRGCLTNPSLLEEILKELRAVLSYAELIKPLVEDVEESVQEFKTQLEKLTK